MARTCCVHVVMMEGGGRGRQQDDATLVRPLHTVASPERPWTEATRPHRARPRASRRRHPATNDQDDRQFHSNVEGGLKLARPQVREEHESACGCRRGRGT